MKHLIFILALLFTLPAWGQRLPNQFPLKSSAEGTDELYTQASGVAYRIKLDTVRLFMSADIDLTPLAYNIDSTGANVVDSLRGRFVIDLSGDWWYVDKDKKAVLIGAPETGQANTGANVGDGTGVFYQKSGVQLQFKSLKVGGINSIASTDTTITITGTEVDGSTTNELGSVSVITNVPDTTSLTPKAGDMFVNAAKDTMGIYATSWVLFFGGSPGDNLGDHTATTNLNMAGNTILGGTGTGSDLILQSTSGVGGATSEILFLVGNNGGTEAMRIDGTGEVGIGTSTPVKPLHVQGAARITESDGVGTRVMLRDADGDISDATLGDGITLTTGTLAANDTVTTLIQGSILVYSFAGTETGRDTVSTGGGGADGNGIYSGDGTAPADVDVTVTDNIDFDAGTLFVDGTNNRVGIGTTTPKEVLHANGDMKLGAYKYITDHRPELENGVGAILINTGINITVSTTSRVTVRAKWYKPNTGSSKSGYVNFSFLILNTGSLRDGAITVTGALDYTATGNMAYNTTTGDIVCIIGNVADSYGYVWEVETISSDQDLNAVGTVDLSKVAVSRITSTTGYTVLSATGYENISLYAGAQALGANNGGNVVGLALSNNQPLAGSSVSLHLIGGYGPDATGQNLTRGCKLVAHRTTTSTGMGNDLSIELPTQDDADAPTEYFRFQAGGNFGIQTTTPTYSLHINDTDGIKIPSGTTAQRPTGAAGVIRYNSTNSAFEGYGSIWRNFIAGQIGSASGTTDASGDFTVTHNLGTTPVQVLITNTDATTPRFLNVITKGATTFTVRVFDNTGAAVNAGAYSIDWIAK